MCESIIKWLYKSRKEWSHNDSFWGFAYRIKSQPNLLSDIKVQITSANHIFTPAKKYLNQIIK